MSDIAIRVENLSKLYKIGKAQTILDFGFQILDYPPTCNPKSQIQNRRGAILGMRKTEIDRQFDEIVAFAENLSWAKPKDREVHGHAGETLLQRYVRAPGLRRGRPSGAGNIHQWEVK